MLRYMSELDARGRKAFLKFTTGSSRLPCGGFKAMQPRLTVVKKCEADVNPDAYLPSVMTCQNFLKLPHYSSFEVMKMKLQMAVDEGQGEFALS